MASPTCAAPSLLNGPSSRNSYRSQIEYDINSGPPFVGAGDPNQGGFFWEINYSSVGPAGPWTPAPLLNNLASLCSGNQPTNIHPIEQGDSTVHIGDLVPSIQPNTQYWTQWVLHDFPANAVVDTIVCGPTLTPDYPTFVCLGPQTTETTADVQIGGASGQTNIDAPCNRDNVVWELSTVSGGPYTAEPIEDVSGPSPQHTFTGLTPSTQYFYRARLSDDFGNEYLITPECSFTTEAPTSIPAPNGYYWCGAFYAAGTPSIFVPLRDGSLAGGYWRPALLP